MHCPAMGFLFMILCFLSVEMPDDQETCSILKGQWLDSFTRGKARAFLQEVETKATLLAIDKKSRQINILRKKIAEIRRDHPDSPELVKK